MKSLVLFALLASASGSDAGVVAGWNERVLAIAHAEDGFLTLKGVRAASMMHLAMHDALNSIDRRYAAYAFEADARGADPTAAVAQAAHDVAVDQYPKARAQLDEELSGWLEAIRNGPAKSKGLQIGARAASAILAKRSDDRWNSEAVYKWQPMGPGVYAEFDEHSGTPRGFVFGAGWASVKPFALLSPDQFRSPPPPEISSDAYTEAYDEVKEVGRYQSPTRTPDQTHLALWWKDFAENSHNRLARQLVLAEHTDLWVAARMFALMNLSIMDGYIGVFDSKFHYNHWRPYTAIHWADHDGNPRTVPDPEWNNTHRHTYPFPSYPSAHGTVCTAAMTVLADTFGDEHAFEMQTLEANEAGPASPMMRMDPPFRRFSRLSEAAMECALSRVYLGIHFRYDSIEGNRLGHRIGSYAVDHVLVSTK
jgi:membrane-associated phospholipid phosphatase